VYHCIVQVINDLDLKVCDDGILIPLLVFWTLSIVQVDWAQLSRLLPEDGDRIQSPKRCFLNKNWTMDNVQKTNNGNK
jgi:hypothetical protein